MFEIEMQFNGRRISSSASLRSELKRMQKDLEASVKREFEESLKKAAGPGVKVRKTREGYELQGTPEGIRRAMRRLS